eukprot:110706_1
MALRFVVFPIPVKVVGLIRNIEYNGCKGQVIGPPDNNRRYQVKITKYGCTILLKAKYFQRTDNANHVYSKLEVIKKYGLLNGQEYYKNRSKIHIAGSLIEKQDLVDALHNSGKAYHACFIQLSIEDQRDVLLKKKQLWLHQDHQLRLLEFVSQNTGSFGKKCDGCHEKNHWLPDEYGEDARMDICPDCGYGVCDSCAEHCTRGTCFCKDSNFGEEYDSDPGKREWYQVGNVTEEQRQTVRELMWRKQ